MKISDLGRATSTKPVTIRFYESIGLLPKPERTGGNYRNYSDEHRVRLLLIRQARSLGFDINEIRGLLDLADGAHLLPDAEIDAFLQAIEIKAARLGALRQALARLRVDRTAGPDVLAAFGAAGENAR